ncbi:uroporphyrinogen-III C-methyltransferase [soil metagenome]
MRADAPQSDTTAARHGELSLTVSVADRLVVIVGAGPRAAAATAAALDRGALVRVISGTNQQPTASLSDLAQRGKIDLVTRHYRCHFLQGAWLVYPRTGDPELDERVTSDATKARIWCVQNSPPAPAEVRSPEGKVSIVGGGPGDPGLITVRGIQLLERADVVIHDRLAPVSLLSDLPATTIVIDAAKSPGGAGMAQAEINRHMVDHAHLGRHVVRLKGGDPFVFGRGLEEAEACAAAGVAVEVVPGVTSAISVPALAGISLTHRGIAHAFTVISGHLAPDSDRSRLDWAAMVASGVTLVLMMAVETLPSIAAALLAAGMDPDTPTVSIQDGASPRQTVVHSRLGRLARDASAIKPPAITVIGPVVARQAAYATFPVGDAAWSTARPQDVPASNSQP